MESHVILLPNPILLPYKVMSSCYRIYPVTIQSHVVLLPNLILSPYISQWLLFKTWINNKRPICAFRSDHFPIQHWHIGLRHIDAVFLSLGPWMFQCCSREWGRRETEKHSWFWCGNLNARKLLEDLNVGWAVVIKLILTEIRWYDLDWINVVRVRAGRIGGGAWGWQLYTR